MKTDFQRKWQKRIAIILCFTLMLTSLFVGSIITAGAYTNANFYTSTTGTSGSFTLKGSASLTSGSDGSLDIDMTANQTLYFYIQGDSNNNYWGCDVAIPLDSEYNLGAYYSQADAISHKAQFTSTAAGTYRFQVTGLTGSAKIKITQQSVTPTAATTAPTTAATTASGGESGTSTDTVNSKSDKTLIISYDKQNNRNYTHVWYSNGSIDGATSAGAMEDSSSDTGVTGLYYKDITNSINSTAGQINFLCKEGTGWGTNQSSDVTNTDFKKGKQWYLYNSSSSGDYNDTNDEYTPLKLSSIVRPNYIEANTALSFTVNVTGGVPEFMNTRGSTDRTYKLSVGTTSGGTNLLNNSTCNFATKEFTFNWTPTTTGSQTLYFTLTDGIDTVTYSKSYTVTEKKYDVGVSAGVGGSVASTSIRAGATAVTLPTATADAAYDFVNWTATGGGITITNATSRTAATITATGTGGTVTANFVAKKTYAITTVSNNKKLGSVSVSPSSAYSGQQITVTDTEGSGTLSSIVITKTSDGTDVTSAVSYSSSTKKFTMPAYAVTVTGNFTLYEGNSKWYYNGYSTSGMLGTSVADGYGIQMTEAMVDGKKFSYHEITSRTGSNQLFTVSNKSPVHAQGDHNYIYFHGGKDGSDSDNWYKDHDIWCWFTASDGKLIQTGKCMDYADWSDGYKMWRSKVPKGAKYVSFKDYKNNVSWTDVDLTDGYRDQAVYWTNSTGSNGKYKLTDGNGVDYVNPVPNEFHEYFYNMDSVYYNTTGHSFGEYGVSFGGDSHKISNPSNANTSGYYVLVLYPDNTYTINGDTVSVPSGSTPYIVYTSDLPGGIETVTLYAKDGTVRRNDSITTTSGKLGNTIITNDSTNYPGVSNIATSAGTGYAENCDYQTAKVEKGMKFQITTTVEDEFKSTHYVKAFMVNGKGVKFFNHSNDGVYTMEYTVPEEFDGKTIEVTPVYFLKDESDTVTFKIEGFDPTVQTTGKWGTTLYAYPFYAETIGGHQSAFYGYPGQPVVEDNGKYFIQIPIHNSNPDDTNHTTVRGITLSNGYLDDVHKICESTYVVDHRQTYDYDDFYKIYNEKHPDNITFSFKYKGEDKTPSYPNNASRDQKIAAERTAGNNHRSTFTDSSIVSSFEQLTNYHGQIVNIFGTVLDNVTDEKTLYVISDGYWYNNAGSFGTEWCVFTKSSNTYTYLGEIVPSALALNSADSFDKAAYAQTADADHGKEMLSSYKTFYNTLKASYSDYQVKIIYEDNIKGGNFKRINATNNQEAEGEDTAYRLDGRWTYSNDNDIINANIQIRYLDLNQSDIKDSTADTFVEAATSSAEKPVGDHTGAVAYFTNSDLNQAGQSYQNKMATGNVVGNKNKEFTFTTAISTPKTNNYVFQGWYLLKDGKYSPMSKASSPMNSTETYVALYRQSSDSTFTVSHNLMSGSGAGLTEVKLEVTGSTNSSYDKVYDFSADPITATIDTGSTVIVTLSSTSAGANTFNGWYNSDCTLLDNGGSDKGTVVNGAAKQITLTPSDLFTGTTPKIRSKEYLSDFTNVTRQFKAVFHYTNRAGQNKTYTVKTLLDTYFVAAHPTSYSLTDTISEGVTLKQWVKDSAPSMIDLYGKNIKWTMTDAAMTSGFSAAQNKIDIDSATEIKTWNIVVETHSDGNVNNASTKHTDTKSNIPDNTYAKNAGVYYTPENNAKFSYWSVFPLDLKTGNPKNNNELLRIYNYEFKVMITGNYYVKAIYTPGTVTKASVQEAVYSREVYDLDETGDTKKDDLYSDFIYSYMSERNSVELKNNENYLSGLAVEVSQSTKVPEGTSKAVDYSEYTFDSDNSNIKSYVVEAITPSTVSGTRIGKYTYTADGKSDTRSVYCYPISNSNYNNFNRGDFAIMYGSNQSWTKYIMKAYYYVKNKSTGTVQISEPVYFCLHNTKVTVFASSNTIVES